MGEFQLDTRQFQSALREYGRATQKDAADILNRAGRNVAIKAIQLTPKATAAKIKAELGQGKTAIYATIKRLRLAGISMKGMGRQQFAKEVKKTIGRRASSAGYVSTGWFNALEAFGGRTSKRKPGGNAAKGRGTVATADRLLATLTNAATGAEKVGGEALQQAVDAVAQDMSSYAEKKFSETARKYSAR